MRALSVVSTTDRRGAEVFATELASWLGHRGHAVRVLALAPANGADTLDIAHVGRSRSDPRSLIALVRAVRAADVVVSNGGTTLLPTAAAAAMAGRPFVYRNIGDPTTWGDTRFADARIGIPLRRAARVVGLYQASGDELLTRYRLDPERLTVIPNAVDVDQFPEPTRIDRQRASNDLGLSPDLTWIGFVGALSPEKNPLAAIAVVAADPRLGLVVAGAGPMERECRSTADRTAPGRVRFLGRVPSSRPVLQAIDALVLPSRTEGIPGVAIEAGLCGVPVVASAVGGLAEVVTDGVTGTLLADASPRRWADGLRAAVDASSDLGPAARRHCLARFSFEVVGAAWSEVLEQVAAESTRQASRRAAAQR